MTEKKDTKRKLIRPQSTEIIQVTPTADTLMNDALSIISAELSKYRTKCVRGVHLDPKEARIVQGYIESLAKLKKEEREAARAHDLSNLSDEELLQLAASLAKPKTIASKSSTKTKKDSEDE
jgi:hypothetical protein